MADMTTTIVLIVITFVPLARILFVVFGGD